MTKSWPFFFCLCLLIPGLMGCLPGQCDWTDPVQCLLDSDSSYACRNKAEGGCMVTARSLNSSNPLDGNKSNQLYQCRCDKGDNVCNPDVNENNTATAVCQEDPVGGNNSFSIQTGTAGDVIYIAYANLWKCERSTINCAFLSQIKPNNSQDESCTAKILPNAFPLIRYWCQNKASCQFDLNTILSYVYTSNGNDPLPVETPAAVLEWRYQTAEGQVAETSVMGCGENQVMDEGSCYRLTDRGISWSAARAFCLNSGGDLARFSSTTDFFDLLARLDPENTDLNGVTYPVWFKWYSWDGEQRVVQDYNEYVEGFTCSVIQDKFQDGTNPLSRCYGGKAKQNVRGLCVLPPVDVQMNRSYRSSPCPASCISYFDQYFDQELCFNSTAPDSLASTPCPMNFDGMMYRQCSIDGQWESKPEVYNCTSVDLQTEVMVSQERLRSGASPAVVLTNLTNFIVVKNVKLVGGDLTLLDETLELAIEFQEDLLANSTALPSQADRERSAIEFTEASSRLVDRYLSSTDAYWMLDPFRRFRIIDRSQKRVDDTLYQLAVNLGGSIPFFRPYDNLVVQVEPARSLADYKNESASFEYDGSSVILPPGYPYAVQSSSDETPQTTVPATTGTTEGTRSPTTTSTSRPTSTPSPTTIPRTTTTTTIRPTTIPTLRPSSEGTTPPPSLPSLLPTTSGPLPFQRSFRKSSGRVPDDPIHLFFSVLLPFNEILYGDSLNEWERTWTEETQNGTCKGKQVEPLPDVVNTRVIGTTLGDGMPVNFNVDNGGQGVQLNLSLLDKGLYYEGTNRRCVFWDPQLQDWSDEGCREIHSGPGFVTCECDHLTNFAVIMDYNGIFTNADVVALDWITMIGLIISSVCLVLALIILFWVRTLRKDFRFHIHRNLCLCLLLAELLMLFGLDYRDGEAMGGCQAIAVILHFAFLCCFGWMLVEGLYLYFLITKVFDGSGLKRWQYYMIGYGAPVVLVAITMGATQMKGYVTLDQCGDPKYCWLNNDNGAIWAFLAPVALVILMNFVFLLVAVTAAFRARRPPAGEVVGKKVRDNGRVSGGTGRFQWLFGAFSLNFVLGITWIYGFLFFNNETVVMAYIFTVFNSLQGFVIFMTLIVLNKQVRMDLRNQIIRNQTFQRIAGCCNVDVSQMNSNGWTSSGGQRTGSNRTGNTRNLTSLTVNVRQPMDRSSSSASSTTPNSSAASSTRPISNMNAYKSKY